jgi:excisionase family DNA binding protein
MERQAGDVRESSRETLDELLTVDDVAALLKVTPSWVYEHTRGRGTPKSDRLPHVKLGKYVRFEARALRAFLEKKCRVT